MRPEFLPFEKARNKARKLGLRGAAGYKALGASTLHPLGLPANPQVAYADDFAGWADFLGNEERPQNATGHDRWLPFATARAETRRREFGTLAAYKAWARGHRASGLPVNPDLVYEGEWAGAADWLGTEREARGRWRPYAKAARWVRELGLSGKAEWASFPAERLPRDIPKSPESAYSGAGWKDWVDWLVDDRGRVLRRLARLGLDDRDVERKLGLRRGTLSRARSSGAGRGSSVETFARVKAFLDGRTG